MTFLFDFGSRARTTLSIFAALFDGSDYYFRAQTTGTVGTVHETPNGTLNENLNGILRGNLTGTLNGSLHGTLNEPQTETCTEP